MKTFLTLSALLIGSASLQAVELYSSSYYSPSTSSTPSTSLNSYTTQIGNSSTTTTFGNVGSSSVYTNTYSQQIGNTSSSSTHGNVGSSSVYGQSSSTNTGNSTSTYGYISIQ
jgi:hypothetical protein